MSTISQKLATHGIILPPPAKAVAAYVPFVITGNLVFISGQLPMEDGKVAVTGLVGADVDLPTAQRAARLCALNIIAQVKEAAGGDLDRVARCVKLGGFVASASGFYDQPKVVNGASELITQIFGEDGRHARAAVGVNALPLNATVEIEAIFNLR